MMRTGLTVSVFSAALSLLAAGCTLASGPAPATCPAASLQHLVGQTETALGAVTYDPMRIVHPGEFVTMEFNPARLDVRVDDAGDITSIRCG